MRACARGVCVVLLSQQEKLHWGSENEQIRKNDPRQRSRATLMFSQRNNPYCELLQISSGKINAFL